MFLWLPVGPKTKVFNLNRYIYAKGDPMMDVEV
jgi:hypothetical protein